MAAKPLSLPRRPVESMDDYQLRSCRAGLLAMRREHDRKHPRDPVTGRFVPRRRLRAVA